MKICFFAILLTCCCFCAGQATPKEITNSDVIQMTKAGIADGTIILVIQRGPAKFDTSPQGLIALKAGGVSDKVLDAILASTGVAGDGGTSQAEPNAARALFQKALRALGPPESFAVIHSVRWTAAETQVRQGKSASFERSLVKVYPDRVSISLKTATGALQRQVITPELNYRRIGDMMTAVPDADLKSFRDQLPFDTIYIAQHPQEFTVTSNKGSLSGAEMEELTISKGGASIIWVVNPENGRILSYRLSGPSGVVEVDLSDWRPVGGISVAFKRHTITPSYTTDEALDDYVLNPPIDELEFQRPAQPVTQGLTLRILQSQSMPYVRESNGGISTNCNIVGTANTSAFANSVGSTTFGNATTTSNQHMSCSSYDTTIRWPHVLNVMFAEGSDGISYMIACDRAWRWSKCVPLRAGDTFNARFTTKGVEVEAFSAKGKEENPTYQVLQSRAMR